MTRRVHVYNNYRIVNSRPSRPTAVFAGCEFGDFDLFPELTKSIGGIGFPDINILNKEVSRRTASLGKMMFYTALKDTRKRWKFCIVKQGDYIEGLLCGIQLNINIF